MTSLIRGKCTEENDKRKTKRGDDGRMVEQVKTYTL